MTAPDQQAETDDKRTCCEACGCGLVLDAEGNAACAEACGAVNEV